MIRHLHYVALNTHKFIKLVSLHWIWLMSIPVATSLVLLANSATGAFIPTSDWTWLDIVGEGGFALFSVFWMMIVLATRKKGLTTNWLAFGFLGMYVACLQDVMDEMFLIPTHIHWDSWVESFPIGLTALAIGLLFWYREQRQLDHYLGKRAAAFQNQPPLNEDSLLPSWAGLVKAIDQVPNRQSTLVLLRATPETTNQPPLSVSDTSKLRFLLAEMLLWNVPESIKVFHLTGESYALFSSTPIAQEQINGVVLLLRAMRFHGEKRVLASHLHVKACTVLIEGVLSERALRDKVQCVQKTLSDECDGIWSRHSVTDVQVA